MENLVLNVEVRTKEEGPKALKPLKMLAGIVYGHHQEPIMVKMDYSTFLKMFRISGENHVITLDFGKNKIEVLVHDIQREPVSGDFQHIDFIAVVKGEKVHTHIPLVFVGDSAAAKEGAVLEEHIKELEVKCEPKDLVDNFTVDLSTLAKVGDVIKVSDLVIDKKITVLTDAHATVVVADKPKVHKVEEEETVAATTEATA
jgi:large subunit ribosomal protein L25